MNKILIITIVTLCFVNCNIFTATVTKRQIEPYAHHNGHNREFPLVFKGVPTEQDYAAEYDKRDARKFGLKDSGDSVWLDNMLYFKHPE